MAVPIVHYEITFPDIGGPVGGYDMEYRISGNEENRWYHKEVGFTKEYQPDDLRPLRDSFAILAYNETHDIRARSYNMIGADKNWSDYSDIVTIQVDSAGNNGSGNPGNTKQKPSKPIIRVFLNAT